jgi:heat-inducible transcriptional repressor
LSSGIFDKIELIPVSATRLLVIISIRTGLVKTVMLEVQSEYRRETLDQISIIMNERLAGLTLQQIRDTFCDRLRDVQDEKTGLIRLFIESVDQIFIETHDRERLHISGTQNIIVQPEFIDPKNFRSVIELIENEEMIVHLLEKHQEKNKEYFVTIGSEHNTEQAKDYSIVSATYESEGVSGTVGVIGPKRMEYPKLIPLVEYVAHALAKILKG